jgi:phosphotransferase system enzyme I (PtsI)
VIKVLFDVVQACNQAGTPITLCGEMAGQPRAFILLLGMGLRSFSMSPAFIPTIKELAGHVTQDAAERILRRALTLKTTSQIQRFMADQITRLAPDLALLDTA